MTAAPRRFLRARHDRLIAALAKAETEYRKDARYNGRLGVMLALKAVLEYVVAPDHESDPKEKMEAMKIVAPLTALASALASLDRGLVEPMLKRAQSGNAPPLGLSDLLNRAHAAAAMHALMKGGYSRKEAARYVAKKIEGRTYAQVERGELWQAVARWRAELQAPSADPSAVDVLKFRAFFPHIDRIRRDLPPSRLRELADRILADQVFGGAPVPPKVGA